MVKLEILFNKSVENSGESVENSGESVENSGESVENRTISGKSILFSTI
jgi:hypothetical protein